MADYHSLNDNIKLRDYKIFRNIIIVIAISTTIITATYFLYNQNSKLKSIQNNDNNNDDMINSIKKAENSLLNKSNIHDSQIESQGSIISNQSSEILSLYLITNNISIKIDMNYEEFISAKLLINNSINSLIETEGLLNDSMIGRYQIMENRQGVLEQLIMAENYSMFFEYNRLWAQLTDLFNVSEIDNSTLLNISSILASNVIATTANSAWISKYTSSIDLLIATVFNMINSTVVGSLQYQLLHPNPSIFVTPSSIINYGYQTEDEVNEIVSDYISEVVGLDLKGLNITINHQQSEIDELKTQDDIFGEAIDYLNGEATSNQGDINYLYSEVYDNGEAIDSLNGESESYGEDIHTIFQEIGNLIYDSSWYMSVLGYQNVSVQFSFIWADGTYFEIGGTSLFTTVNITGDSVYYSSPMFNLKTDYSNTVRYLIQPYVAVIPLGQGYRPLVNCWNDYIPCYSNKSGQSYNATMFVPTSGIITFCLNHNCTTPLPVNDTLIFNKSVTFECMAQPLSTGSSVINDLSKLIDNLYLLNIYSNTTIAGIAASLTANIAYNMQAIGNNAAGIANNTVAITNNTQAIVNNTKNIAINTVAISNNTVAIVNNTVAIANNTANIVNNTRAIQNNSNQINNISAQLTHIPSYEQYLTTLTGVISSLDPRAGPAGNINATVIFIKFGNFCSVTFPNGLTWNTTSNNIGYAILYNVPGRFIPNNYLVANIPFCTNGNITTNGIVGLEYSAGPGSFVFYSDVNYSNFSSGYVGWMQAFAFSYNLF